MRKKYKLKTKKLFACAVISYTVFSTTANPFIGAVFAQENAVEMNESSKTAIDKLGEEFPTSESIIDTNLERVKNAIFFNFLTKADDAAMKDVVRLATTLNASITREYYLPLLAKYRRDHGLPGNVNDMSEEQRAQYLEYVKEAQAEAIRLANANATNNDELQALSNETKIVLESIFERLIKSQPNLTTNTLKDDIPKLFRGLFYLVQQFNFEDGLVEKLIFAPETLKGIAKSNTTPYSRLKTYGGTRYDSRIGQLRQNRTLFNERISNVTGFTSIEEMLEKLAQNNNLSVEDYYKRQSEAILAQTEGQNIYNTIKISKSEWYLPILARGKGIYAAASENAITIGMLETYRDLITDSRQLDKNRGDNQPQSPFFMSVLKGFDNYMHFINTVKKKEVPFVTVVDSMNHKYDTNPNKVGQWSKASGDEAAMAVRTFFTPMGIYSSYTKAGVGIGGESNGPSALKAFETRLMHPNMQGVGLFSHEMTHGNDEAALYNGEYSKHGRRIGQGQEIYARGLFEAIDNSQNTSEYRPVFNINTSIDIGRKEDRVQASQALNTKDKVESYFANLMDLIAYLEVKEAEVAIEVLSDDEKSLYFNKVSQVEPTKNDTYTRNQVADQKRIAVNSTNDRFAPFGKMSNPTLNAINEIGDLVKQDAVSAQFIPNGRSPFIANLETNQYDSVPLLESYYASSVAENGKNTVGDISFKRHAYEVLGWKGWEAFVAYVSDKHDTDVSAFNEILNGEAESWEAYKIKKYNELSNKKPIDNLWDEEDLKNKLKLAIKNDLTHIRTLRNNADSILENYTDTPQNRSRLTSTATNINFDNVATNVRAVKLEILRSALNKNDLMSTVLKDAQDDLNRQDAIDEINQKSNEKISSINSNNTFTKEEKDSEIEKINTIKQEAIDTINSAQDQESIDSTKVSTLRNLENVESVPVKKIQAINEIRNLFNQKKNEVNDNNDLIREEKTKFINTLSNIFNSANNSILDAITNEDVERQSLSVQTELRGLLIRGVEKSITKDEIENFAQAKIDEIRQDNSLTDDEIELLVNRVNSEKQNSINLVNGANQKVELLDILDNFQEELEAIKPSSRIKDEAKKEIEAAVVSKNNELDTIENFTSEEKAEYKNNIERLKQNAFISIMQSRTDNDVITNKNNILNTISSLSFEARIKPNATKNINDLIVSKKSEILAMNSLTQEEKNRVLKQLDEIYNNFVEEIKSKITNTEVEDLYSDINNIITNFAVIPKIKPQSIKSIEDVANDKLETIKQAALSIEKKEELQLKVNEFLDNAKDDILKAISDIEVIKIRNDTIEKILTLSIEDIVNSDSSNNDSGDSSKVSEDPPIVELPTYEIPSDESNGVVSSASENMPTFDLSTETSNGDENITVNLPKTSVSLNVAKNFILFLSSMAATMSTIFISRKRKK